MLCQDKDFYNKGYNLIVGVDEAGRGPLCGPVVAGAVILPKNYYNEHINDSKKLSPKQREIAFKEILKNAVCFGIGYVSAEEIDKINIYEASRIAMIKAIKNISIKQEFDLVISDDMPMKLPNIKVIPFIKGDAKFECVAAGSILAKVCRDHYMIAMSKKYPLYHFDKNKGYGTKEHMLALDKYGPIKGFHRYTYEPVRKSFVKQLKLF